MTWQIILFSFSLQTKCHQNVLETQASIFCHIQSKLKFIKYICPGKQHLSLRIHLFCGILWYRCWVQKEVEKAEKAEKASWDLAKQSENVWFAKLKGKADTFWKMTSVHRSTWYFFYALHPRRVLYCMPGPSFAHERATKVSVCTRMVGEWGGGTKPKICENV